MTEPLSTATLDSIDFLQSDLLLNGEERLVRDTVARFVADQVRPHIAQWWDEGVLPRELIPRMGEMGLLGMHLEGYGCAGTNAVAIGFLLGVAPTPWEWERFILYHASMARIRAIPLAGEYVWSLRTFNDREHLPHGQRTR